MLPETIELNAQGAVDYTVEAFALNVRNMHYEPQRVMVIPTPDAAIYVSKEDAILFFGLGDIIEELRIARIEAESLAVALHARHYKEDSPDFGLCDSVGGIISQIDNMACGLIKNKKVSV